MRKEISCGCVIFDKATHSKVLIVYEKNRNFWGFPKGHIEEGETEIQTALREVKEEVGIDVKVLDEKYRYAINYIIEDKQVDKTSVFYIAETLEDDVEITNQEAEIEDIPVRYILPDTRPIKISPATVIPGVPSSCSYTHT